jgi:hypothetical protein
MEPKPGPSKRAPNPARPPATPPPVEAARPGAWKAYVHPMGSDLAAPVEARTESISAKGVQILIQDRELLQVGGEADVASTMAALGATYGSEVALRLVDGTTPLWTGPARIEMIEVGMQAPYPVTLWLAYGRALRPAELRALELA